MNSLFEFQREVGEWADATFPRSTPSSIMRHLTEEVEELQELVDLVDQDGRWDVIETEAADTFLLLLHLAHKIGFDLLSAGAVKFGTNQTRRWQTEDVERKGYRKHVEEGSGATSSTA